MLLDYNTELIQTANWISLLVARWPLPKLAVLTNAYQWTRCTSWLYNLIKLKPSSAGYTFFIDVSQSVEESDDKPPWECRQKKVLRHSKQFAESMKYFIFVIFF